ncbi:Uncharacterised protein [Mycobacteroides abscessus subsp. abscessus]|nr:Uncharacterised protein [Mycobacteroides abscessus subsp. abscessus]
MLNDALGLHVDDTGQDRHLSGHEAADGLEHQGPVRVGELGHLAAGAQREDGVHTTVEQARHDAFQRGQVDVTVGGERGDQGRDDSAQGSGHGEPFDSSGGGDSGMGGGHGQMTAGASSEGVAASRVLV